MARHEAPPLAVSLSWRRRAHAIAILAPRAVGAAPQPNLESEVDKLFAKWNASTPGCAVGVGIGGRPVLTKAYGMADLEHDVPNTPETIFEAGSVAKQFTAMAVLLLAKDGKLSLDDQVRKYIPELPDYGAAADHPAHADAHERPSRLGQRRRHRGLATDDPRVHARARARHRLAAAIAELSERHELVVQQHRLQPRRDHRRARQRPVVRGVLAAADVRAARHAPHVVARRPHENRQGARDRLRREQGHVSHRDAVRKRPRQRRAADDGWRPAEVERELRQPDGRARLRLWPNNSARPTPRMARS